MYGTTIMRSVRRAAAALACACGVAASGALALADDAATQQNKQQGQTQSSPAPDGSTQRARTQPTAFVLIVPVPVVRPLPPVGATLAPDVEQIRDTLASATEAAVTKGGFDDMVERLVDADRNRIGSTRLTDKDLEILDGRIAQLRKAWRDKYGSDFDIEDEGRVYSAFGVIQGEVGDHPRLAASSLGPADRLAGNDPADVNLDPGRNVALVGVPQAHGQPELSVLMIHELPDNWRIDLPDTVSGRELHDNLLKHLTYLGENVGKWPASEAEAYRQFTHHVLAAMMGLDAKKGQPE